MSSTEECEVAFALPSPNLPTGLLAGTGASPLTADVPTSSLTEGLFKTSMPHCREADTGLEATDLFAFSSAKVLASIDIDRYVCLLTRQEQSQVGLDRLPVFRIPSSGRWRYRSLIYVLDTRCIPRTKPFEHPGPGVSRSELLLNANKRGSASTVVCLYPMSGNLVQRTFRPLLNTVAE